MGQYYVGLDVHSRQSVFVVEREDGTATARGQILPTLTEIGEISGLSRARGT